MSYNYGNPAQSGGGYGQPYGAAQGAPYGSSGYNAPAGGGGYGTQPGGAGYGAQAPAGGYGAPGGAGGYGAPGGGYGSAQGYPGAGFATQARPAPQGADPEVWNLFCRVDRDASGVVSANELQGVLLNDSTDKHSQFDLNTIKLLMSIFDTNRSGTIGFNEFVGLYKYIKDWLGVFAYFDRDRSGTIDGGELRQALDRFGYTNFSPQLLELVEKKYTSTDPRVGPRGISFDHFICACVHIKQLTEAFRRLDTDHDGVIQINYDSFMLTALNAT